LSTDSAGRREGKKLAIREALVEAAGDLFGEVGYDAARTSDIAIRADVAQATLFRHFATKAELALYHLRVAVDGLVDDVDRRPDDETPFDAVMAVIRGPRFAALTSPCVATEAARIADHRELVAQVHRIVADVKGRLAAEFARRLGVDPRGPRALVLANVVADIAIYTMDASLEDDRDPESTFTDALLELRPLLDVKPAESPDRRA
jgi:AcrR family transcriptional regulator